MLCLIATIVLTTPTAADELFDAPSRPVPTIGEIRPLDRLYQPPTQAASPAQPEATETAAKPFGAKGSQWWTFGGGYADNFSESSDFNLRAAWSSFIIDQVEFSAELNGWYFAQPGDNAVGINPAFVFRWHAYNDGTWTLYTDAGIGLLFSSDDVPDGGTSFNFTPRIGAGLTYRLGDSANRLQFGLRWHHVSNARIRGDSENPARDGLMIYAGIIVPY